MNFCLLIVFPSIQATILAIRSGEKFVDTVSSGEECGFVLDRTCFYAESGGQTYDEGYIVKADDENVEFQVRSVFQPKKSNSILFKLRFVMFKYVVASFFMSVLLKALFLLMIKFV